MRTAKDLAGTLMHSGIVVGTGVVLLVGALSAMTQAAPPEEPGRAEPLLVFVLTGQSNSLGTTADPTEMDITPGESPLDKQVRFFWSNRSTRAGDGPAVIYSNSDAKITTLQAQQGEGANKLFWGPEIAFGRRLAEVGLRNVMLIKASRGGGGNRFWVKGGANDQMYRHVIQTVQQAIAALPPGTEFSIAGLLYVQGESDGDEEAAASGQRLRQLALNLRQDLPRAGTMQVLIGGIAAPGPRRDLVRAQQAALAKTDPTFHYVDMLDLQPQLYDNLHFNKAAKLELGRRLADTWLAADKRSVPMSNTP